MGDSLTHKGIKFLSKKDFTQAQYHFNQALAKKPFDPWSYMNLALSHDLLHSPDKALKTYHIVSSHLMKKSNSAVFYSYFNKGELHGRLGQLEKTLENYQQALEFRYKEKEIKKNIELLFQNNKPTQGNKKKEKQEKNQSENSPEQKNEDQQDGTSKRKKHSSHTMENQEPRSENRESDRNHSQETKESKGLNEKEQKAIFEEIEKQENKARAKFYQRKKIFGDKTKKDW